MSNSRIFSQNRAMGYVTNGVPPVVRYIKRRKENLVVTSVGKAFHTYGCDRFSLLSVSQQHSSDINCLAADTFLIFTASGNIIYAWRRGVELKHTYKGHTKPVHLILPFGPHIISVDEDSFVFVWDIKSEEVHLELDFKNDTFRITAICHPATYINKILFGSEQGEMQLWNINTSTLLYLFKGWSSPVTVLEQTPAIDVVAVGLVSGKIILHNIRYDESILKFEQDWGPVTALSFRTDGPPIMVSASLVGHVIFWNLEECKVVNQLLNAHDSSVTGLKCLPNEPLLITTSPDNSLKMWIFDKPDGGARLLRIREGHSSPPTFVRFYDQLGQNIISSGTDSSLRIFNTVTEIANKSLGRASYNRQASKKKGKNTNFLIMPRINSFACGVANDIEMDDIATIHSGSPRICTWSFHYARMSEIHIINKRFKANNSHVKVKTEACSVCFSRCMHFIIVGYSSGHVDKFNIQSGYYRGSYGNPVAHSGSVRGVATDNINRLVITGGSDQFVKFWQFKNNGKPYLSSLKLDDSVSFFGSHQESSMLAIALDDFSLILVDIDSRIIVRKFTGHIGVLNDVTFSPDSRWLISAAMDGTIRTWDILSGHLIDYIMVDVPCISLSFSPSGEYLATVHVEHFGIYLWANKTLFSHISLRPIENVPMSQPVILSMANFEELSEEELIDSVETDKPHSKDQIFDLITLSQMASSRWQNILNIDIIKKRNKPQQPPRAPESAPFFLPTVSSLNFEFDFSDIKERDNSISKKTVLRNYTAFGKLLHDTIEKNDFNAVIENIKTLSPSVIHFEVTSLSPEEGGSEELLLQFLKMIEHMFISKKDFELAQSYLGIFIKMNETFIIKVPRLIEYLNHVRIMQEDMWKGLENKFLYCLAIVDHLRDQ